MLGRAGSAKRTRAGSLITLVLAVVLVCGIIVGAVTGLVRDTDKWGWGLVLFLGVLAAFSLIRNLLGMTPSSPVEPKAVTWWHKLAVIAVLFLAFMIKGLSALGLSMVAAVVNAAGCIGILFVTAGAVVLYERRHGINR